MFVIILFLFILGLYLYVNRKQDTSQCPDLLVQHGNEIWLQNTKEETVPGFNPMVFHSLDEYTNYRKWQASKGKTCPILELQKVYNAQNEPEYRQKPMTLVDASRGHSPYNDNMYPGMDPYNQTIGQYTVLDTIKLKN